MLLKNNINNIKSEKKIDDIQNRLRGLHLHALPFHDCKMFLNLLKFLLFTKFIR